MASRATRIRKLDGEWTGEVYSRGEYRCEFCGKTTGLNAHHIFSRSNFAVRWDPDNGVCLCVAHHVLGTVSFHKAPAEMLEWVKAKRGAAWYDSLRIRAGDIQQAREQRRKVVCPNSPTKSSGA